MLQAAAAIALYLLYADNEPSAEVYGAVADRQQASIVFDVARQMVEISPTLLKRSKIMGATKQIVNYGNAGYYQVLSAEVGGKHGFSVSGLVFDEIHTQPNRQFNVGDEANIHSESWKNRTRICTDEFIA